MSYVSVGKGKPEGQTSMKVVLSTTNDTIYLSPKYARDLALDLIIQAERLEKEETWEALKG